MGAFPLTSSSVRLGRRRNFEGKFFVSNNFVDVNYKNQLVAALMKSPTQTYVYVLGIQASLTFDRNKVLLCLSTAH